MTSTAQTTSVELDPDALGQGGPTIIYDGECPLCSAYVRLHRLQGVLGSVKLVDARSLANETLARLRRRYDLDEGMIFALNGRVHHGADAVNAIALLSSESGAFNRLNAAIFRSPRASRVLYPLLRLGRALALRVKGVDWIHGHGRTSA